MIELYNKLLDSDVFKKWKEENKDVYLSSYVLINNIPQFDFYESQKDKITSFLIKKKIKIKKDQNIFKKSKIKVNELKLEDIKISLEKAEGIISDLKDYQKETFNKKIIILQNMDVPLWNISLISVAFNILNVKINAIDGSILSEKYESLLNFKAS